MCPSAASVCRHVFVADEERYALNSSAERGETQEPVNNSSNSILFLHDCSPALTSSTLNTTPGCGEELVKSYLHTVKLDLFTSGIYSLLSYEC